MEFFEVSAKEGKCIDDTSIKLAQLVFNVQLSENQVSFLSVIPKISDFRVMVFATQNWILTQKMSMKMTMEAKSS